MKEGGPGQTGGQAVHQPATHPIISGNGEARGIVGF